MTMADKEFTALQKRERKALAMIGPKDDYSSFFDVIAGLRQYRAAVTAALAEVHNDGELNAVTVWNLRMAQQEIEDLRQ